MRKPLVVELFAGRFGWSRGFVAEGFRAVGFDIVHEPYHGDVPEGCSLALQDVLTLHGSQFRDAAVIVASPPCQAYSYMAMPWKLAKAKAAWYRGEWTTRIHEKDGALIDGPFPVDDPCGRARFAEERKAQLTALFDACFRIQREASEAAGRYIPMVVENVKGAQPWVGPAKAHFGSFYLWGDVESVGGRITVGRFGQTLRAARRGGAKVPGLNWSGSDQPGYVARGFNVTAEQRMRDGYEDGRRVPGFNFHEYEKTGQPGRLFQSAAVDGVKVASAQGRRTDVGNGVRFTTRDCGIEGVKCGGDWFNDSQPSLSRSPARKAASALIAEIPIDLARYIARCYHPGSVARADTKAGATSRSGQYVNSLSPEVRPCLP